ncbi:FeoB-associated Cys-rich membrane protein [Spirosoma fluviale]|uniref:Virus attachment protein p12 family protein n=1 Tax=Spirosoma fluviale TaxID=1597977 RepID=A0A286FF81_9BACT|nr:FeoB-associated Cys-rich membrane protein [Spirosoma fluviale]SOD81868.1 Virus attachment protein p12 family protein [Spirosoma fluviale]
MQELIIFLIFAVAVGYLGNRAYRSFSAKKAGCGKGCGCATDASTSVRTAEK